MSLNSKLQALKSVLSEILNNANEILVEKGKEPANNIEMALSDIASLPSGDDTLSRIALEAPTEEEKGTVDLKLDSSWGNLRSNAFFNNTKLKTVDLSDCVNMTSIPTNCFKECSYLSKVDLSQNIETIGDYSFEKATKLTEINFPTDSKTHTISTYAFYRCLALGDLYLPPLLKTVSDRVLSGTTEKAKKIYFRSIPKTVHNMAFSSTNITDIYLPCGEDIAPSGYPWGANAQVHFGWNAFKHIEIITAPEKTSYIQGEVFNPSGMKVRVYDENYGTDDMGEIIASDELGFDNLEYSKEPLLPSNNGKPFYIYYTDKYGERHITDIEIFVGQA